MKPPAVDTTLSRRELLQVGAVGALGLGLPELLQASAPAGSERSCIFIVQYGGASHIDSLDLKPQAPDEVRGPYRPIATSVPGLQVCELLPRLARLADRYCVVRSMTHGNGGQVKDRPVSPENFGATLFHALGIRPETRLGPDGFTRPASAGQPVFDLFG